MSGIIEHICVNPEHRPQDDVPQPVVVYTGSLAYCPLGAVGDHEWRATGGKTLATVREWLDRPARSANATDLSVAQRATPAASRHPAPPG